MGLLERDRELTALAAQAKAAQAGSGSLVLVHGESGAGKSTFVEAFLDQLAADGDSAPRVLEAACDPLSTPRPLGPVYDLLDRLGEAARRAVQESDHSYEIFNAVFDDLAAEPTVLVVDDLHWADQGTVDLLRFVQRRIGTTSSMVIGALRDDELGVAHPMRTLLGDVARSPDGRTITLEPLSIAAIDTLIAGRPIDARQLRRLTGGNPFFIVEMLAHDGSGELPATVRDAVLARTVGLGVAAWDLLHLLVAAPEAIPDHLLAPLGITLPALRELDAAGLIRRGPRRVGFRHDLCRLAIGSVIPPGAEPVLHRRMIEALEATNHADAAVLVHHAIGAGDRARVLREADRAGKAAARSGAHTQAVEFYRLALDAGELLAPAERADLLERMAASLYLIDRLADAIGAATEAMQLRDEAGDVVGASVDHNALSVYEWYNAERAASQGHVDCSIAALADHEHIAGEGAVTLGHAYAMRAYLALHTVEFDVVGAGLSQAKALASATGDPGLTARVGIVDGARSVLTGDTKGRDTILSILADAPDRLDEVYSSGYSNLTYLDVEQRRLRVASELLDRSIPMMAEHDLPICRAWQTGSRARLAMMDGDWSAALADADEILSAKSAPLAQLWPYAVRGLVGLRRSGEAGDQLERAWELATQYGEPIRLLPVAAALAEQMWLTGSADPRLDRWVALLASSPVVGLEWARGELAVWLRRLDVPVAVEGVAAPYETWLAGDFEATVASLDELGLPYDAALARLDWGSVDQRRRALDMLDRLGAHAVADKARRELRSSGATAVPARRRAVTRANPAGLTPRQVEVLIELSDGSTNAELASRLYLSEKTVDHHISAILTKLGVANRRDAARRARELGLIE